MRVSIHTRGDLFDLAAKFLASLPRSRDPWEPALRAWAEERGLGGEELRELRRAVLRHRVFGAVRGQRKR